MTEVNRAKSALLSEKKLGVGPCSCSHHQYCYLT